MLPASPRSIANWRSIPGWRAKSSQTAFLTFRTPDQGDVRFSASLIAASVVRPAAAAAADDILSLALNRTQVCLLSRGLVCRRRL